MDPAGAHVGAAAGLRFEMKPGYMQAVPFSG